MTVVDAVGLRDIAEAEFRDIVLEVYELETNLLRILLHDGSFIDVWHSLKISGRFSYHWERTGIDGTIFRHDNAPHPARKSVRTFPKHFHDGSRERATESDISDNPEQGLREFLRFARLKLRDVAHG